MFTQILYFLLIWWFDCTSNYFFYQDIIFSFDMMLWYSSLEVSIFVFIFIPTGTVFPTNLYFAPFHNNLEVIGSFHYFQSHSEDLWLMKSNLHWKCKTTSVIWYLKKTKISEKKIFEISANQSILLALAAMLNIRLERKTVTL